MSDSTQFQPRQQKFSPACFVKVQVVRLLHLEPFDFTTFQTNPTIHQRFYPPIPYLPSPPSLLPLYNPSKPFLPAPWPCAPDSRVPTSASPPPPHHKLPRQTNSNLRQPNRVGVFATLTNSYAIVAIGASENFYRYATHGLFTRGNQEKVGTEAGTDGGQRAVSSKRNYRMWSPYATRRSRERG